MDDTEAMNACIEAAIKQNKGMAAGRYLPFPERVQGVEGKTIQGLSFQATLLSKARVYGIPV